MADSTGTKHGPILSPMESIPGDPNDLRGDNASTFDGVPGYPKGSGGKIPEVTFDNQGTFGKVPIANKGE
jgi:hypothetical protein